MSPLREFITKKSAVIVCALATAPASLLFAAMAIRTASAQAYGGFVVISSLMTLGVGVAPFGIDFRFKRNFPSDFGTIDARWPSFAPQFFVQSAAIFIFAVIAAAAPLAEWFDIADLPRWALPGYLVSYGLFSQAVDYLRYSGRIVSSAVMGVLLVWLQIALTGALWLMRGRLALVDLFTALLAALALTISPVIVLMCREMKWQRPNLTLTQLRHDFALGYPVTANFVLDHLISSGGRYALALMLSVGAVAHYNSALLVANLALFVPRASTTALQPLMSRYFDAGSQDTSQSLLRWSTRFYFIFGVPFVAGACILDRRIMACIATQAVADQAQHVLPLLAAGQVAAGLVSIWGNALFVSRDLHFQLRVNALTAGISLLLICMTLYRWPSVSAVAAIFCGGYFVSCALLLARIGRTWDIVRTLPSLRAAVGAALIMSVAIIGLRQVVTSLAPTAQLVALIVAGTVIYLTLLAASGTLRCLAKLD